MASVWIRQDEERPAVFTIKSALTDGYVFIDAHGAVLTTSSTSESDPTSMGTILLLTTTVAARAKKLVRAPYARERRPRACASGSASGDSLSLDARVLKQSGYGAAETA